MQLLLNRFLIIIGFIFIFSMCVPPQDASGSDFAKEKARLEIESQTSSAREQLTKQADDLSELIVNRLIQQQ